MTSKDAWMETSSDAEIEMTMATSKATTLAEREDGNNVVQ